MTDVYESDTLLHQYLLFHYGTAKDILPPPGVPAEALAFPVRTAETALSNTRPHRALDLGCAVGRSACELSIHCAEVVAIDFSQSFIDAANQLKSGAPIAYERLEEASLTTSLTATAPDGANPDRITFRQGDAMNLPGDIGAFDLVHAANLLCRLPDPLKFLNRLPALVNPGGRLFLATPCTWLEEFTPRHNWPPATTLEFLQDHLTTAFSLEKTIELPFLIREHSRKFQLSSSQTTIWTRAA